MEMVILKLATDCFYEDVYTKKNTGINLLIIKNKALWVLPFFKKIMKKKKES